MVRWGMSIDDEYAAIGIDLRALRRASDVNAPADNPVEAKLGRAVLQMRLYWGWSQREVGRHAGVSQSVISRLECGVLAGLSLRRLFAVLRALRMGELLMLPRPPAFEPTPVELLLRGDPWKRAATEADKRLSRRRSA